MCDYKKAVVSGVISYAVLFLIISGLMATPLWTSGYVNYVTLAIGYLVAYFVAQRYYFRNIRPKQPMNEGLVLGILMAAVAFLIEIPVMVYGFAAGMGWGWFFQWHICTGYLLIILAAITAAHTLGKAAVRTRKVPVRNRAGKRKK